MYGARLFLRHIDDDEEIVRIVHKHWLLGVRSLIWPVATFLASCMFVVIAGRSVLLYASALAGVASLVWMLRNFYDYYLDAWIITSKGIIDVEWFGWFHRQSSRVLYSDIQGVSYEIQGVLGTVLRYGTISVEKISTGSTISLAFVLHPRAVESLILKCMEGYLHSKNLTDAKHVQEILSQIIAREVNLEQFEEEDAKDADDAEDDEE